jgi:hypothetical protein
MHDFRDDYDADVVVIDIPVSTPATRAARQRRSADEELEMQVLTGGTWHRRTPDLANTACGQRIASQFSPLRRHELSEPMCGQCFTAFELATAAARTAADRDGTT